MTRQRSDTVNMAKAVGIILMVIGHSGCPQWLHDLIYVFHMPLFFFLSGYCLKEHYLDQKLLFARKRMKRVWWTFVKWNLLFFALNPLFFHVGITNEWYALDALPQVLSQVLTMRLWHELLGPYWFLRYLLLSSFAVVGLCWLLRGHERLTHALFLLMPVVPTVLALTGLWPGLKGQGLLCCFFYYAGFALRGRDFTWRSWHFPVAVATTVAASLVVKTEIPAMEPRLTLVYALAAMAGITATMGLCSLLGDRCAAVVGPLTAIGRHTLTIMTFHLLSFKLVSALLVAWLGLGAEELFYVTVHPALTPWWAWTAYSLVGLALPLLLVWMKQKVHDL